MFRQKSSKNVKADHPLSNQEFDLLKHMAEKTQFVLRLTGAPLELIRRGLAVYSEVMGGYELRITNSGAAILHTPTRLPDIAIPDHSSRNRT